MSSDKSAFWSVEGSKLTQHRHASSFDGLAQLCRSGGPAWRADGANEAQSPFETVET